MERFSPCNVLKSKFLCSKPPFTVGFLVTWGKTTGIYVCTILLGSDAMAEQYAFRVRDRLPPPNGLIRFANFEVDVPAGELRKNGVKIKLHTQPFEVLTALLLRHGQVVTREELQQKLWAQDTFVDFEQGLNKAINKLRDALGDDADNPQFVETLPRRGYRFVAPVTFPPGDSTESSQRVETLPRRGYPFISEGAESSAFHATNQRWSSKSWPAGHGWQPSLLQRGVARFAHHCRSGIHSRGRGSSHRASNQTANGAGRIARRNGTVDWE